MAQQADAHSAVTSGDELDPQNRARLFAIIYDDLRKRARRLLSANDAGSLNTTGLVHEAYLKVVKGDMPVASRAHFFNIAAAAMRQIIVDHARYRQSQRRDHRMLGTLDTDLSDESEQRLADVLALDDALSSLRGKGERLVRVVELHFFAGLSFPEISDVLEMSLSTVERDWRTARALLYARIGDRQS